VAAVIGIGRPEVRRSGKMTDVTIISETGHAKEEAGLVQKVTAGFR
jgi:hypothetical protein